MNGGNQGWNLVHPIPPAERIEVERIEIERPSAPRQAGSNNCSGAFSAGRPRQGRWAGRGWSLSGRPSEPRQAGVPNNCSEAFSHRAGARVRIGAALPTRDRAGLSPNAHTVGPAVSAPRRGGRRVRPARGELAGRPDADAETRGSVTVSRRGEAGRQSLSGRPLAGPTRPPCRPVRRHLPTRAGRHAPRREQAQTIVCAFPLRAGACRQASRCRCKGRGRCDGFSSR